MPKTKTVRKPRHKKPTRVRIPILTDTDLLDTLADAEERLGQAEQLAEATRGQRIARLRLDGHADPEAAATVAITEELAPLRAAVDEAAAAARAATDWYVFEALGRRDYNALIDANPPSEDDHAKAQEQSGDPNAKARFAAEPFSAALVAACCVSFDLNAEEVAKMFEEWNEAESVALITAAMAACTTRRIVPVEHGGARAAG